MSKAITNPVSFYKTVKNIDSSETIPFDIFLDNIGSGKWEDIAHKVRKGKTKKERAVLKEKYAPSITVAGVFSIRKDDSLIKPTGLIAIDIDEDGFPAGIETPDELKSIVCPDRFVHAAFTTISGRGLCIIMKVNAAKHREHFQAIGEYLLESYGIIVDPTSINISRPRFVSYDPHIYIADTCDKFTKLPKEKPPKRIEPAIYCQDDFDRILQEISSNSINITQDSYFTWLSIGFALSHKFGEGGRNAFHAISQFSSKYKYSICDKQYTNCLRHKSSGKEVTISTFYYYAKKAGVDIYSARTRTIAYTTQQGKKAGLKQNQIAENLKKFEDIEDAEDIIKQVFENDISIYSDTILDQLELWMRQNYSLRRNTITKYIERDGIPLEEEDLNSIFIRAKKIFPELNFELMNRLINSDFVSSYNPILSWFTEQLKIAGDPFSTLITARSTEPQQNPQTAPEPPLHSLKSLTKGLAFSANQIPTPCLDALFSCIKTRDADYLRYFGLKWFVGAISALYYVHSPLMFILSGDVQNTGKTQFFRRLPPPELKKFYAESKLDAGKDDEILMTQKWIIMDDEMGGKSKKEEKHLKYLTSKDWFSLRKPYGKGNIDIRRLCVLCATTNDNEILSDPTGNRRMIPIHVYSIDNKKYNKINKTELWLEAFRLYHAGFDWELNTEDIAYLKTMESFFEVTVSETELIQKYFEPGELLMTATDIKVYIEKHSQQRLSIDRISKQLKKLGFEQRHVKVGKSTARKYLVNILTPPAAEQQPTAGGWNPTEK